MKIVQYGLTGNRRPWDSAPGFYHFAMLKDTTCYRSYTHPQSGYSSSWSEKGATHLTKFRLELIF